MTADNRRRVSDTLAAAAQLASDLGVGVHIHVAEGPEDGDAEKRLAGLTDDRWLLVHGVHLSEDHELTGTIVHNPRSNMNNAVGYANPARFDNPVALGTDGIGADMLDEFRLAYVRHREADVEAGPDEAWEWMARGRALFPEAEADVVTWNYPTMEPWHLAFSTGVRPLRIEIDEEVVWDGGKPTQVDAAEIRAKAAEQARRLHARL